MRTLHKRLLYLLYAALILIFFLYFLFPSNKIKQYIAYKVHEARPGLTLDIEEVSPVLPPGLTLSAVDLAEGNRLLVEFDRVKVTPRLLSLTGDLPTFAFQGAAYGGVTEGIMTLRKSDGEPAAADVTFSGIRTQQITALQQLSPHTLSGILNGRIVYTSEGTGDVAEATLALLDGAVNLNPPLFSIEQLTFTEINAKLTLRNRQALEISEGVVKGNELGGRISGTIALREPIERSVLNLSGAIRPHPAFIAKLGDGLMAMLFRGNRGKSEIPFILRGTIENPEFRPSG